jgi:hypothetical protein
MLRLLEANAALAHVQSDFAVLGVFLLKPIKQQLAYSPR